MSQESRRPTLAYPGRLPALKYLLLGPSRNRGSLVTFQERQLRAVVHHAYREVPFYRCLFDSAGFHPSAIRGLQDLAKIPFTTKADIAQLPLSESVAESARSSRLWPHHTSGSTGMPLAVRLNDFEDRYLAARRVRPAIQWGWRPWRSLVRIKLVNPENQPLLLGRLLLRSGLIRLGSADSLLPPDELLDRLEKASPQFVLGYPEVLHTVAQCILNRGGTSLRPRALFVGGATMYAEVRRQIEKAFNVPVKEAYACQECNLLASQCPESLRLHVADDAVILEVLRDGKPVAPGESGEVVVTSLHSFAQPLIRYRLSDWAVRGPFGCPCGSPCSTVERVEGRLQDWILFPDESHRSPDAVFEYLLEEGSWIHQFQMVQYGPRRIELRIVRLREPEAQELQRVEQLMRSFSVGQLEWSVRFVERIPAEPNGKYRIAKSLMGLAPDS